MNKNFPIVLSRDENIMYDDLQYDNQKGIISLIELSRNDLMDKLGN